MMVAAEALLTETRETIEALTVSALQQAHEMSHRLETTAESFFQAHKDMTVTSKEQARSPENDVDPTCGPIGPYLAVFLCDCFLKILQGCV